MKKWIAHKLFGLALWLDTGEVIIASHEVVDIYKEVQRAVKAAAKADAKPKRKPGRPLGSKDKQPRKRKGDE